MYLRHPIRCIIYSGFESALTYLFLLHFFNLHFFQVSPKDLFTLFYMYECFICLHVCVPHVFLVLLEVKRRGQIP